jgi:2-dehydro-3-deoxyphosphogluconate aldolase/(4S)-4-hydroxy-2-oxoglutarate aldolase
MWRSSSGEVARVSTDDPVSVVSAVGVIPVVTVRTPDVVLPLCEALLSGGLPVLEVTFRSEAAVSAIELITEQLPEMCVGAGTVTDPEQARRAEAAGARFAVAPGLSPAVVQAALDAGLPFWPGVCTPSEIEEALRLGLRLLKFFPAGALGGANTVKAVLAPYLHLGLQVIPTGQIGENTAPTYWALDGVAAVGGSWIAPPDLVASGDWGEITRRARASVVRYCALRGECPPE